MSERQILFEILARISNVHIRVNALERMMTDLSTAVADLTTAVDGIVARLLPKITALETANGALQVALDGAAAVTAADKATIQAAIDDAAAATAAIRDETATLNSLTPTPPPPVV